MASGLTCFKSPSVPSVDKREITDAVELKKHKVATMHYL